MSTIEERTVKVIADQYGFSTFNIKPEQRLEDDLEGDSLDRAELVITLENEFGIEIPDSKWLALETVADVHKLVAEFAKEAS